MNCHGMFLSCSALVCLAAIITALNGGITVNIYRYDAPPQSVPGSSSAVQESAVPAREEQHFTSSPKEYSDPDLIYDPTMPYDAVYGQSGEFNTEQELNTVTLKAGGAVLRNKTIHRSVLTAA